MKALDTNVLVYASFPTSPHHHVALDVVRSLAEGIAPWALPWPCVYEYLRISTHPRIYQPPLARTTAWDNVHSLLTSPSLLLLSPTKHHAHVLAEVLQQSGVSGNLVHDAYIVTLCREHGVETIVTGDRDLTRFSGIRVENPFASSSR